MNILIVEDNRSIREVVTAYVEEMGHKAIQAENGSVALNHFHDHFIEMVIMDVEMPGMNGFETTRRLRSLERERWFPIVYLSVNDDPAHFVEGIDSGGDTYLAKPVNGPVLRAMVRAMSRISQMQVELQKATKNMELLANRDKLTGLANRRGFDEAFKVEWDIASKNKHKLSCLMIDIDFFKQYNDKYGHIQGDKCLIRVASLLKESLIGNTDTIARYGGEEFCILIPNLELEYAEKIAKRLVKSVADDRIPHINSEQGYVTISIGCSTSKENDDAQTFIHRADEALYQAKETGRNQACISNN